MLYMEKRGWGKELCLFVCKNYIPLSLICLKVVGNEKLGGSGVWLLVEYCTGLW